MSKNKNLIQVLIGLTEQALLLTIAIATISINRTKGCRIFFISKIRSIPIEKVPYSRDFQTCR